MAAVKIKRSRGDVIFDIVNCTLLIIISLSIIYPLYVILIASISDPYAVMRGEVVLYPKDVSFVGYERLLEHSDIWHAYANTIFYTVTATLLNIFLTMLTGYALSRQFIGKKFVNFYFIFTMFFGGGLIPTFLQVKAYGLYNNPLVFIILSAFGIWNVVITKTFILYSLPSELYDAAVVDGCSHFRYLFQIVFPLSKALIAVLAVYYGVGHWNDFMTGIIYIVDRSYQPLQVILKDLLATLQISSEMSEIVEDIDELNRQIRVAESVKYCSIVVSTLPILILCLSLQKYFVKGVMMGSLKG